MKPFHMGICLALLAAAGLPDTQALEKQGRSLGGGPAAPGIALADLVHPARSPLTKMQLVKKNAETVFYLQPQVSGFIVKGGFFITVAHPYDADLIRRLNAGELEAYAKFPLFETNFFQISAPAFPQDIIYIDESRSIFKNHTYLLRLAARTIDYENDFSIWSFNPELAAKLPSLAIARQTDFAFEDDYYLLQSADPENSTGYLISPVKLDGIMHEHRRALNPVGYRDQFGQEVGVESKVECLSLGERLVFNGYFKFGTSGSPFLNKRFEVIGLQSSALYTQYKYAELLSTEQGRTQVQYQGFIFNRCVAIRMERIREALQRLESKQP